MPKVTEVSGVAGIVPGGHAVDINMPDFQQFAAGIIAAKKEKETREKEDAKTTIDAAIAYAKAGGTITEKMAQGVEKAYKTLGIDVSAAATGTIPGTPAVKPNEAVKAATSLTPGGGTQSATPPSESALNKAPAGGVTSTIMNPQQLQGAVAQAASAVPPGPETAHAGVQGMLDQLSQAGQDTAVLARYSRQLELRAFNPDNPDYRAMGQLYLLGRIPFNAEAFLAAERKADPTGGGDAVRFALGHESPADTMARLQNNQAKLLDKFAGKLSAEEINVAATALTNLQPVPPGIDSKIADLTMKGEEAEAFYKFLPYFPAENAWALASAKAHGIPLTDAMPKGLQSFTERQVVAAEKSVQADMIRAGAAMAGVNVEKAKLLFEADKAAYEKARDHMKDLDEHLAKTVSTLVDAKKLGVDIDEDVLNATLAKVGPQLGLTPEETKHWYQYLTGGTYIKFTKTPLTPEQQKSLEQQTGKPQGANMKTIYPGGSALSPENIGAAAEQTGKDIGGFLEKLVGVPEKITKTIEGVEEPKK